MKKMVLASLLIASSSAFASMDSDISTMIHYASIAVKDHAIHEVGMTPGSVKVAYNYNTGLFKAVDTHQDCSFKAKAKISYRRLAMGHHWRVIEIPGSNTCR